ncbi:MAG: pyridoxal phosphate-dependent aminotransferase family protein [Thermoguttaceae bacterium]|jgi:7-keto-8-aminopelargonate synthetase-like enzyme
MHSDVEMLDSKTNPPKRPPTASRMARAKRKRQEEHDLPALERLEAHLRRDRTTRMGLSFFEHFHDVHLKDLVLDSMDDHRRMTHGGHTLWNFGSDSFLGLDRHPAVQQAMIDAVKPWGTHNGASRAFSSVRLCEEAERRLAAWLGVEDTFISPSVTLANAGLIPAVVRPDDLLVVDRQSHDSIQQAAKVAAANGARLRELHPCHPARLEELLAGEGEFPSAVVAMDGVYSMTGRIPPLAELDRVTRSHGGVLYVDDAHGTGVVGPGGRGAAFQSLGSLREVLMVGSLSKAFSCMGAFVTCSFDLKKVLKLRTSTFIFGGPVPPPYLAAVVAVCDILESPEYEQILGRLHARMRQLTDGLRALGLSVLGGEAPIISVPIGDIERTLEAGKWVFDRGYYVQSATYPAVPINGGVLRIQVNANHTVEAVDGLLGVLEDLKKDFQLATSGNGCAA